MRVLGNGSLRQHNSPIQLTPITERPIVDWRPTRAVQRLLNTLLGVDWFRFTVLDEQVDDNQLRKNVETIPKRDWEDMGSNPINSTNQ